jgi:hypothetical protein
MDAAEAVFLTFKAQYDGDTGDGGLRDREKKAYVNQFLDPDDLSKTPAPYTVQCHTDALEDDTPQSGSESFSGIVTLRVFTPIDGDRTRQRLIVDRLRTMFHVPTTALTAKGDFNFRPPRWLGSALGQRTGELSVRDCRVFLSGSK